jgi:hypothetical protein
MSSPATGPSSACGCADRPVFGRLEEDVVLRWPVLEAGEWEELRQCPDCSTYWLSAWPEELESNPILVRPIPAEARRLRDVDRSATLRPYCLARLEDHLGDLKEQKRPCKKVGCERKRLRVAPYCLEHVIAQRFGRHLSKLDKK